MNVGEVREALAAYPDDMPVAVIGDDRDIDREVDIDVAISHPGSRLNRRGCTYWHWKSDDGPDGTPVVVFY